MSQELTLKQKEELEKKGLKAVGKAFFISMFQIGLLFIILLKTTPGKWAGASFYIAGWLGYIWVERK